MVVAALVTFGALLVAWILAPERRAAQQEAVAAEPEALPAAA